jgi:ubiquinone/menaquinone biosynthesis C-methylase UbiE
MVVAAIATDVSTARCGRIGPIMNRFENWFCSTNFWSKATQNRLLPAMLQGFDLGSSVLELGAGTGAATASLAQKFPSVTSLEYSAASAVRIAQSFSQPQHSAEQEVASSARAAKGVASGIAPGVVRVVQGDAAHLPFAAGSFSCAIAILVLHHLRSPESQDRALAEICRVLQPGGMFVAFEINDGWLQRTMHIGSTFVPMAASAANARLNAAGFSRVAVDFRRGGFLLRAKRAESQNGNF